MNREYGRIIVLSIDVKVFPSSGRVAWKLEAGGRLKCYLKSPPEKGKANRELITVLSKSLKLPGASITIVLGATSRIKRVRIDAELSFDMLLKALGIERQMSLF